MSSPAIRFIETVADGEYDAAVDQFTAQLGATYSASELAETWTTLQERFGPFVGISDSESFTVQGHDATAVTLEFAGGTQRVRVVVEGDAIAGLQYLDAGDVSYDRPAYVEDDVTETDCVVDGRAGELPGTLARRGVDSAVGVVLVHGSGPMDRDGTVDGSKPLKDLALGLASAGVPVLRYDKRTAAESVPPAEHTLDRVVVEDAVAAVDRMREEVDAVVVVGHSLGGMAAPLIAARSDSVSGLGLLAANARPLSELLLEQSEQFPATETRAEIRAGVERIRAGEFDPDEDVLGFPGAFWRSLAEYDPIETASDLSIPMAVFQGESDAQVSPEKDFGRWRDAFADDSSVTFQSYADLDHLFRPTSGPEAATKHVASEVIVSLTDLLLEATTE
ncbi:alpha/beta fold hydrolase [Halorussus halobius]|uniref:alpha/beta fold hydrolase n=1 Tax=Halorussus halobius TaxID=1710537 RepID=UPI0010932558|nr:alpha/beta fold hydrolase [Halorussus halobius]